MRELPWVIAIASLALLLGAPEDAVACHRGDPRVPHGNQTFCDGGGGGTPTEFIMLDGNGGVVGPVINYGPDVSKITLTNLQVIASTQDQRLFFLGIDFDLLQRGDGFRPQGQTVVWFENFECEGDVYLDVKSVVPNVFYAVALLPNGNGGLIPFVSTSFEVQFPTILSAIQSDGSCSPVSGPQGLFPAEQLTDEFGDLVYDINTLYPPPLRIEVK